MSDIKRRYGWKRDLPDIRDFTFKVGGPTIIPDHVDLRNSCPAVYDQGELGSCTANAICGMFQFNEMKEKLKDTSNLSRLFLYYNERAMEGTVNQDAGAAIRDGIKSAINQGICDESVWPYDISQFSVKPSLQCYFLARRNKITQYSSLSQNTNSMLACLAQGYPFVFGFSVYSSFESQQMAQTGQGQLPKRGEQLLGGHAVVCVGYDQPSQRFLIRNSWGNQWGMAGYFTFPYSYLTNNNLSSDFWTIRTVT